MNGAAITSKDVTNERSHKIFCQEWIRSPPPLSFLQNRTGQLNFVNKSDEPSFRSPERENAISGRLAEDDRIRGIGMWETAPCASRHCLVVRSLVSLSHNLSWRLRPELGGRL